MKSFTSPWKDEIAAGRGVAVGAVKFDIPDPPEDVITRMWGGYGELELDGEIYKGVGELGKVIASGGELGSAESSLQLVLSGVDPEMVSLIHLAEARRAPVLVWRLGFNAAGQAVLDETVFARGRVATGAREETAGGEAAIVVSVETAVSGLRRGGGRMRTLTDQAQIDPTDTAYKNTTVAKAKTFNWGGMPPGAGGDILPGTGGGGFVGNLIGSVV